MREFQEAVAVFDLDRTITRFGTFSPFLVYSALNRPWRFLYAPLVITLMLIYKAGWLDRSRLKESMLKMVAGRRHDELTERSPFESLFQHEHAIEHSAIVCFARQKGCQDGFFESSRPRK